ncbi:MAG: phosphohistidine phosphatase [bacterium]|jgi:phosphohistidine phosphatase
MAAHLRAAGVAPELILCSTSARTRQTLARIAPAFDLPPVVLFERGLYGASADALLARLRALRDGATAVMVIAHSSGIEDLALLLARQGEPLAAVREKFPTGALATLAVRGSWRELGPGSAELVEFVTPRELQARAGG